MGKEESINSNKYANVSEFACHLSVFLLVLTRLNGGLNH